MKNLTARLTGRLAAVLLPVMLLAACGDAKEEAREEPVRGLKVFEVSATADNMIRRYPSVIQPADESRLSFEIAGQLTEMKLEVGQEVDAGQVLLTLDPTTLRYEVQQAEAALEQADASLVNARTDYERKSELLKSGNVTRAAFDSSETNLKSAQAQMEQSRQQLAIARERMQKSTLKAPFDGVIASLDVKSFANIGAGQTVLTLYSQNAFEVEFSVPATVINALSTGDQARVVVTDLEDVTLKGRIKELGSRAGQVSAFPAVVILEEDHPGLKAGMAAEVALNVGLLTGEEGFLVPVRCFALEQSDALKNGESVRQTHGGYAQVYVYDEASSTVKARKVRTAGVRDNMIIVTEGLNEGEIIAAAGVSYLHDGQKVRPLQTTTR
ncbi:efflux RND transporter periplasmic adaptor subunit [Kordiimonas gwangyangensis]|uniref:efflux RND transporter periplasmic adaptor subunit n=1 Tax=Kordiimonas gwangyangensis TaxID=288022 RepID=UPI0003660F51|nr:efflux RND transporter periplasmic adaptor subunit [Kordiimonas gwangyangensis]